MDKASLRTTYKKKRSQLAPEEIERCSAEIVEHLFSFWSWSGKIVSVFLPIQRLNEINTYPLIERLKEAGATVCLSKSNLEDHSMDLFQYEIGTKIIQNAWGIPEPRNGAIISPQKVDVVIIPLLISDEKGNRVGYGKGFYDRFLSQCRPDVLKIGLNFFDEFVRIDNVDENDVPLNYLVNRSGIHFFSSEI
jgi:5-formyltetrahydrofolate cyclo-ligase